jgi:hypothetical protein
MSRPLDRRQILERRRALLNKLFPGSEPEDHLGEHKFTAERGVCTQCGLRFTNWVVLQPDGTYRAGIKLCPVIGPDEVANFIDYESR